MLLETIKSIESNAETKIIAERIGVMLQIASLNGHLCHIWRPACDLNGGQPRTH